MKQYTLHQGGITAILSEVAYQEPRGFQESGTWQVAEGTISAKSNVKLTNGSAKIRHDEQSFPVTVIPVELESFPGEQGGEPEYDEAACYIEIEHAEGVKKLALALGLLGQLTLRQRRALEG